MESNMKATLTALLLCSGLLLGYVVKMKTQLQ